MAENDNKIIKYTITRLLAGCEHSKHELLKRPLQHDFERHSYLEWIDKFNLQSNIRFAESLIRGRTNKGRGKSRIRNELKKHQISVKILATVMYALNID